MDRLLGIIALVLALSAPSQCRRLQTGGFPDFDRTATAADYTLTAEHHTHYEPTATTAEERSEVLPSDVETAANHVTNAEPMYKSAERYGLLPTPNIASPILSTLILPTTFPVDTYNHESDLLYPIIRPSSSVPVPAVTHVHEAHDWPRHKHLRKIKIHDDGSLWTKFPNKKHLVEIVPIKNKSKTKGKALAYIVPKSHNVKKKLRKQNRISDVVVDRNTNLSDVLESSNENPTFSPESTSNDSDSDSIESNSSDREDKTPAYDHTNHADIRNAPKKNVVYADDDDSTSENKFSDKLNDIVSYFKEHKDVNLNSLVHDVLPEDEIDPEYHVHYIIHKKHNNNQNTSKDQTHHDETNIIHVNHKLKEKVVNNKQIKNIYPQSDDHEIVNKDKNHHNHEKLIYNSENSNNKPTHSLHRVDEQDVKLYHNTVHSNHDLKHDVVHLPEDSDIVPNHSSSSEDVEHVTPVEIKNIPVQSLEQLHELFHDGNIEPDLNQLYDIFAEIEKNPGHGTPTNNEEGPQIQHIHVYADNNDDNSDESDNFDNHSDDLLSQNYSESLSEVVSDESESGADFSDSKAQDSVDSSDSSGPGSDSEDDSLEDFLYRVDSPETIANYHDSMTTEVVSPDRVEPERGAVEPTSSSSESTETNSSVQHDDASELTLNHLTGHDLIFPNCSMSKKKHVKKCNNDCKGQKSYTLTFLFNR